MRLEKEVCQFWAKEIMLKIEYKYCPNLTIIDTPGLIAAAPGRKNHSLQVPENALCMECDCDSGHLFSFYFLWLNSCQKDWWHLCADEILKQVQGRAVEALVRTKMQHKEFIILCLEDCSDWSNATTRRIVMQVYHMHTFGWSNFFILKMVGSCRGNLN